MQLLGVYASGDSNMILCAVEVAPRLFRMHLSLMRNLPLGWPR